MGVYIPNMKIPSCCALCDLCFGFGCAVSEHDKGYKTRAFKYDENGKCEVDVFHERASWCPLIEIVRCGECKWWVSAEESNFKGYCSKQIDAFNLFDETDFCSYGERRTDERITE